MRWALLLWLCLSISTYAQAATISIVWNHRTYVQEDVSRYRLYWGTTSHAVATDPTDLVSPGPYDNVVDVIPPKLHHILDLPDGTYYFRMLAVDDIDGPGDNQNETQFSEFNSKELIVVIQGGRSVPLVQIQVNVEVESDVSAEAVLGSPIRIQYGGSQ